MLGEFVCFGSDAAAGVSVWLSTPQTTPGACWQEKRCWEWQKFILPS